MILTKRTLLSLAFATAMALFVGSQGIAAEKQEDPTQKVVQGNNEFAIDLYKKLAADGKNKNVFFSPYSITQALAMTFEGARNKTALEMGQVLDLPKITRQADNNERPWNTELFNSALASLNKQLAPPQDAEAKKFKKMAAALEKQLSAANNRTRNLEKQGQFAQAQRMRVQAQALAKKLNKVRQQYGQYELTLANALWGEQTYPFSKEYLANVREHFKSGALKLADFRKNWEAERLRINAWVAKQTRDRIKNILKKNDLNRLTRLVLANAIYFKGDWAEPFNAKNTKPRDFTLANGTKIKAPTMTDFKEMRYGAFNADGSSFQTPKTIPIGMRPDKFKKGYPGKGGFAAVELPYRGGELSMVVIAPQDPNGLPALEKKLNAAKLAGWVKKMNKRKVNVFLPKFKLETGYSLKKPLQELGMREAFIEPDPSGGADFSGMTASKRRDLYIGKVIHKAFVEVNEKGTEAAAATVVVVFGATSAPRLVPFNPTFKADRPFLFMIRHVKTGSILFMGKVANPKG